MKIHDPERLLRCFLFAKHERRAVLLNFVTAGDPNPLAFERLLKKLPEAGSDIVEIGIPFSDPMADGPIIQKSSKRALKAGMTLNKTLDIIAKFRLSHPETPIILMGYYNPIYRYGKQAFLKTIKSIGVDGLIIVDLPPEEDSEISIDMARENIHFIRFITPTSTKQRIKRILINASGFIYYISIKGITGTTLVNVSDVHHHINIIKQQTNLPICIGFGVRYIKDAQILSTISDGIIVGSVLIETLENGIMRNDITSGINQVIKLIQNFSNALKKDINGIVR